MIFHLMAEDGGTMPDWGLNTMSYSKRPGAAVTYSLLDSLALCLRS